MAPPRRVEHLFVPAKAIDRLGDKAPIPRRPGAFDLAFAGPVAGLGQHAPIGRGQRRVAEQPPRRRRHAARQIDRGRTRPFAAEHPGHRRDRLADALDHRVAVFGIGDRRHQDFAERHRPPIAQQPHPGAECGGNRGGEQPGAGDQVESERLKAADRRRGGGHPLAADHVAAPAGFAPCQDRGLAERAVQMRLDHLQGKSGGGSGVKGVAAFFEHAHADRRGQPMGRGDGAEGAADLGPGGKGRHRFLRAAALPFR